MNVTPLRVLFLCTGNSARSQMAEAVLQHRSDGRFVAGSAGTRPAAEVNPFAVAELRRRGIDWRGRTAKSVDEVIDQAWDIVITVCDDARESCPVLPGQPVSAHWGVADPAALVGEATTKQQAFADAATVLAHRIDLLLALTPEQLHSPALSRELQRIGQLTPAPSLRPAS